MSPNQDQLRVKEKSGWKFDKEENLKTVLNLKVDIVNMKEIKK